MCVCDRVCVCVLRWLCMSIELTMLFAVVQKLLTTRELKSALHWIFG